MFLSSNMMLMLRKESILLDDIGKWHICYGFLNDDFCFDDSAECQLHRDLHWNVRNIYETFFQEGY